LFINLYDKGIIKFEPCLLIGAPGIGKTLFATTLCRVLELGFVKLDVGGMQANFTLKGADPTWANANPGLISEALISKNEPNFMVFLDEIDKASAKFFNGGDPLAALYELLEEDSAAMFMDNFYGIQASFNASHINFMASGNVLEGIEPALKSRFKVFNIPAPTKDETIIIIQNIHLALISKLGLTGKLDEMGIEVCQLLSEFAPRIVKMTLRQGYASALKAGRRELLVTDFNKAVEQHMLNKKMSIGFIDNSL
jgi:ATP-dependent Lon protease